jgi:hypothetical protein
MKNNYPVNQLRQLLDSAHQTQTEDQPKPNPPKPAPWLWSPITAMSTPMFAETNIPQTQEEEL